MQHESSIIHKNNLKLGLTVEWIRSLGNPDDDISVICYSDDSRWLFDNATGQRVTLVGEVTDGLNKSEVLKARDGSIIVLYTEGIEIFLSDEEWLDSLSESECDKFEAERILYQ